MLSTALLWPTKIRSKEWSSASTGDFCRSQRVGGMCGGEWHLLFDCTIEELLVEQAG